LPCTPTSSSARRVYQPAALPQRRAARRHYAIGVRIAAANDARYRAPDLPSRYGPFWRGSQFWHQ